MFDQALYEKIQADKRLMNRLTWEAANGKKISAEKAARGIIEHPRRSRRFYKLFPEADASSLIQTVKRILIELKDWEV